MQIFSMHFALAITNRSSTTEQFRVFYFRRCTCSIERKFGKYWMFRNRWALDEVNRFQIILQWIWIKKTSRMSGVFMVA